MSQAVNKLQRRLVEKMLYDPEVTDFILSGECILLFGREVHVPPEEPYHAENRRDKIKSTVLRTVLFPLNRW